MAKSHKSATLPTSLRLNPPPMEENENFFSKLKKKLKFKKVTRYNADVGTGDCENVSVVSFRKTETDSFLKDDDSPLKNQLGRSSARVSRSESPKQNKPAARSHSDRYTPAQFVKANKHEQSNSPSRNGDFLMKNSKTDPSGFQNGSKSNRNDPNSVPEPFSKSGNEYSSLTFGKDTSLFAQQRSQLGVDLNFCTDLAGQDDSAIDLETYHLDKDQNSSDFTDKLFEKSVIGNSALTASGRVDLSSSFSSSNVAIDQVNDEQNESLIDNISSVSNESQEIDPNYESVQEVKARINQESLLEPGYQSIDEVKKIAVTPRYRRKQQKKISVSNDSLSEPGYESLNDVKKRISCGQFGKEAVDQEEKPCEGLNNLQDSALGLSTYNDGPETDIVDAIFTEGAKKIAEEKAHKKEDLYSVVNKCTHDVTDDRQANTSAEDPEAVAATTETTTEATTETPTSPGEKSAVTDKAADVIDAYDSDVELSMDPGYAECADAIKGPIVPYTVYSDGSSKISSCTSLDYSVEDFPPEPGYAECADAIKTGAVKKISISYERLVEMGYDSRRSSHEDTTIQSDLGSEIYANPQILLRKKSKLLDEDRNSGDFTGRNIIGSDDFMGSIESLNSNHSVTNKVCKSLTAEEEESYIPPATPEAPPLPARNYSVYLDSEEAETIVSEDLLSSQIEIEDDAFIEQELENNENGGCEGCEMQEGSPRESSKVGDDSVNKNIVDGGIDSCDNASVSKKQLIVSVKNKDGKSNVLTITEKENISKLRCKSQKGTSINDLDSDVLKLKALSTNESNNPCAIKHSLQNCETAAQREASDEDICNYNSGAQGVTVEDGSTYTGKQFEQAYQDCENLSSDQTFCENTQVNCDTFHSTPKSGSDNEAARHLNLDAVTPVVKVTPPSEHDQGVNRDRDISNKHRAATHTNIADTNNGSKKNDSHNASAEIKPVPIVANSFLEAVGSLVAGVDTSKVRMQSISADSDSDECFNQDLPKLEINESDLDDPFHISSESEAQLFKNISELSQESQDSGDMNVRENEIGITAKETKLDLKETKVDMKETKLEGKEVNVNEKKAKGMVADLTELKTSNSETVENPTPNEGSPLSDTEGSKQESSNDTTLESPLCVVDAQSEGVSTFTDDEMEAKIPNDNCGAVGGVGTESVCHVTMATSYSDTSPCHTGFPGVPEIHQIPMGAMYPMHMSDSWTNYPLGSQMGMFDDRGMFPMGFAPPLPPPPHSHGYLPEHMFFQRSEFWDSAEQEFYQPGHEYEPPPRPPTLYNTLQSRVMTPGASGSVEDAEAPPAIPPRSRVRRQPPPPVSPSQDFMESMRQLKDCGWYWGPLSWNEAEQKLANKPEGTFLVRDSSDERYILSLSFKSQGSVHHTRIEHHKGNFSFWSQPDSHGKTTIKEFIEQCVMNSRNGRFLYFIRPSGPGSPPMPIHLLNPVSRFAQMRSLQHMCRFRILQMVRRDHIDKLPMPKKIKEYLKEAQYYVEYLDD